MIRNAIVFFSTLQGEDIKNVVYESYNFAWCHGIDEEISSLKLQFRTCRFHVDIALISMPDFVIDPWLSCDWATYDKMAEGIGFVHSLKNRVFHQSDRLRRQNAEHSVTMSSALWRKYCRDPTEENHLALKRHLAAKAAKAVPMLSPASIADSSFA